MLKQFQNFSVCLSNTLEKKLPKTRQTPLYIMSEIVFDIPSYFAKRSDSVFEIIYSAQIMLFTCNISLADCLALSCILVIVRERIQR